MHTYYIIEYSIIGVLSITSLFLFIYQYLQDLKLDDLIHVSKQKDTLVFTKQKSNGVTARIIHIGGIVSSCVLCALAIDPYGLYAYPKELPYYFANILYSLILIISYEIIISFTNKIYLILSWGEPLYHINILRILNYVLIGFTTSSFLVTIFITNKQILSNGVFIIYSFIIQWCNIVSYVQMMSYTTTTLISTKSTITKSVYRYINNILSKMKYLLYILPATFINTGMQIYIVGHMIINDEKIESYDPNNYSFGNNPFIYLCIFYLYILLYTSYTKPSKLGMQGALSSPSQLSTHNTPVRHIKHSKHKSRSRTNSSVSVLNTPEIDDGKVPYFDRSPTKYNVPIIPRNPPPSPVSGNAMSTVTPRNIILSPRKDNIFIDNPPSPPSHSPPSQSDPDNASDLYEPHPDQNITQHIVDIVNLTDKHVSPYDTYKLGGTIDYAYETPDVSVNESSLSLSDIKQEYDSKH